MKIINQILDTIFTYQLQDTILMYNNIIFCLLLVSYHLQNPIKTGKASLQYVILLTLIRHWDRNNVNVWR